MVRLFKTELFSIILNALSISFLSKRIHRIFVICSSITKRKWSRHNIYRHFVDENFIALNHAFNSDDAILFAEKLLSIGAIKLRPEEPFTWASGWKSPIYCDNRLTLSFPEIRSWLKVTLADGIRQKFPDVEIIAGVATAGIPHGALIAEELGLPFIYVRSEAKNTGCLIKLKENWRREIKLW